MSRYDGKNSVREIRQVIINALNQLPSVDRVLNDLDVVFYRKLHPIGSRIVAALH
jgi:hypothetical protein